LERLNKPYFINIMWLLTKIWTLHA